MHLPVKLKLSQVVWPLCLLSIFLLTGCATIPDVQTDYDHSTNFKIYQTFDWHPTETSSEINSAEGKPYNTLLDMRIKEAIASEMVKQGINPSATSPGLLIAYDISIDTTQQQSDNYVFPPGFGYGYSYWYGYRYNYGYSAIPAFRNIRKYRSGTLVIDLIDKNTNQLVWRGWSEAVINPSATIEPRRINRIVANILSRFPPTPDITR